MYNLSIYVRTVPPHTTGNSAKSLAHCPQIDNSANHRHASRQFCQITGMLRLCTPHTGNSVKSLAHCPQTGKHAKSLAHSSSYRQFCQLTGTLSTDRQFSLKLLAHFPQTDNSASESLACSSTCTYHSQFLPNHWHTEHRQTILQNHLHRQFCKKL